MKTIHIIGAGGVGSWLTPALCLLVKDPQKVNVIDGDTLERKNLNRQLFTEDDIGKAKSEALAARYGCSSVAGWYSHGSIPVDATDWLLCAVDNNPGRRSILDSCDAIGCKAIFMANEVTSAEAYYYERAWKGTPSDPRVYYPELLTDDSADPRAAAIGCTGEAQVSNRQLVSANFMAAALGQHLFVLWNMERRHMDRTALEHVPFKIVQNLSKYQTTTLKG